MGYKYADKYVKDINDIPSQEHWAIIRTRSVTIPGDERSRTNPGHGYSEHTENSCEYEVYLTFEKFKECLEYEYTQLGYGSNKIKGIHVIESYKMKVSVGIEKS